MKNLLILLKFEWLNFRADRGMKLLTILALAAGLYGIYYGTTVVERQRETIAALDGLTEQSVEEMQQKYPGDADAGDLGYYHSTFAVNPPDSWAALSLGQRDLNPYYIKLRLLNLQSQLYDSDNVNPQKVLTGNFDLAFVLVYLFPLLIIGLCFNILSVEKEQGTLPLLLSQPIGVGSIVTAKLLFRIGLVLGLVVVLSAVAMAWARVPADVRIVLWLGVVVLNCLFWFGVAFLVAALQKGSAFNAVTLLGVWLLLTVVVPALLNIYVTVARPVPQALDLTLQQREAVHGGWDKPKQETMERFFAHYPQWRDTAQIQGRFAWRWYYAFQHLGDLAVADLATAYQDGLGMRHQLVNRLSLGSVPVAAQGALNAIAAADLPAHLDFLRSASRHHDAIREFYYPFLYRQTAFTHADFADEPRHAFTPSPDYRTVYSGLVNLLWSTLPVYLAGFLLIRLRPAVVK